MLYEGSEIECESFARTEATQKDLGRCYALGVLFGNNLMHNLPRIGQSLLKCKYAIVSACATSKSSVDLDDRSLISYPESLVSSCCAQ